MFSFVSGNLVEKQEGSAVVENNGIGYELVVSNHTLSQLGDVGSKATLYTYLQVREDALVLFGFATKSEREVFIKLISVSGVGPKMASTILSGITPNELITAVVTQNLAMLGGIKGVGKKTAERLLLELKTKMDTIAGGIDIKALEGSATTSSIHEQAMSVLVDWGVVRNEAYKLVMANFSEGDSLEDLITKALKAMGR